MILMPRAVINVPGLNRLRLLLVLSILKPGTARAWKAPALTGAGGIFANRVPGR